MKCIQLWDYNTSQSWLGGTSSEIAGSWLLNCGVSLIQTLYCCLDSVYAVF
uniref:Uncharacterized protein n=1 Tax=Anguilla anguilla TaxID=7936 RepID=A0A0E9PDA5_ANGAN